MEHSMSSWTFKGSIPEAIFAAIRQKKLFLVYVSGEDAASILLENTTFTDLNFTDTISKNCIFLHLVQGSIDVANFFAIYPQKSAPCITIIGYNGVMLWQHEGCSSSDHLVSSIKHASETLHIQETTATFLTSALASKKSEPPSLGSSNAVFEKESTPSSDIPRSLMEKSMQDSGNQASDVSELSEGNKGSEAAFESVEPSPSSVHINALHNFVDAHKSKDVCLNIHLPEGGSLQKNFFVTDTLRLVKDYVDENRRGIGSYDLAVPYPRKVFKDQDLSNELSELGLVNRQALVIVPHHPDKSFNRAWTLYNKHTTSASHINPSNDNQEGYFGRLKSILSYVNPLSYFGNAGSSASEQEANNGLQQYGQNEGGPSCKGRSKRKHGEESGS